MSQLKNKVYLEGIASLIRAVPKQAATLVAWNIFKRMVDVSTESPSGFDSGQAAANWRIQPYVGSPVFDGLDILWGYGNVPAKNPAGNKSSGHGTNVNPGDPSRVKDYLISYGMGKLSALPDQISGIAVYNPITPGNPGFMPGNDAKYEANALGLNLAAESGVVAEAIASGLAELALSSKAVRRG